MPVGVERRDQVAGSAAGGVGEATLARLLKRGEPAEQHLPGVEHGRRFRLAHYAAADRARWQLNLDFPPCCTLRAGSELKASQALAGGVERRNDVARGLRIRRLPAPAREIGVPREA